MIAFKHLRSIYEALPFVITWPLCFIPFGLVAGKSYRKVLCQGLSFDVADADTIEAIKEQRLRSTLEYACAHVPAYRPYANVLEQHKRASDALIEFPLIDKDELKARFNDFVSDEISDIPHYKCTTGGTSGNQLELLLDDHSQSVEMGFMHRQWSRVGYSPRCRKATFRGVEFPHLSKNVYWQKNPVYNELQFSPFHLSLNTVELYWKRLLSYRPKFLHGYPSAIVYLAELAKDIGKDGRSLNLKAILLGSEGMIDGQRETLEHFFGCRVYSWYGHSERLILAGECENCDAYHVIPDYGYCEILDKSGKPVDVGERGELVGTTFLNRSMVLIRYKTGDSAVKLDSECSCGRYWQKFDNVQGFRDQQLIIGSDGSRISLAAINVHGECFSNVNFYQYYQIKPGMLEIRIVPGKNYGANDESAILAAHKSKVGDNLCISVVLVPEMKLSPGGKYLRLVRESAE